jgi:hypothetical protein
MISNGAKTAVRVIDSQLQEKGLAGSGFGEVARTMPLFGQAFQGILHQAP